MRAFFLSALIRFRRAERGAVAMIFALTIIPTMGMVGAAIDYAAVSQARSEANNIADAAAVVAVSDTVVKPTTPWAQQRSISEQAATTEFQSRVSAQGSLWRLASSSIEVTQTDNSIQVKVCYQASIPTKVLKVVGIPSLDFSNCAVAQSAPPVYVSVYALIDASGSMGIGSTRGDQSLMEARLGCAFACHTINNVNDRACDTAGGSIPRGWWSQTPKCAKVIGARTRFDVVRDALIKVTDQAQTLARVNQQYKLSVHKFSNYLTEVQSLTHAMPAARNALDRLTMDQRGAGTNFYKIMPEFTRLVPASGDGRTADRPKVFVLLLTDGIGSRVFEESRCFFGGSAPCQFEGSWRQDPEYVLENPYVDGGIRSQAFASRLCDDLKRKSVTVLTLATEFDSSGINDSHMKTVDRTLRSLALTGLERCASTPQFAYRANFGPDIDRAISQMFSTVVAKARLVR